jgi:hypothetical protein
MEHQIEQPKNHWKPVGIIFIILAVLFLAGGAVAGWFLWQEMNEPKQETNVTVIKKTNTEQKTKKLSLEEQLVAAYEAEGWSMEGAKMEGGPNGSGINSVEDVEIKNSSITPWQYTEVGMRDTAYGSGWTAMFYRDGEKGEWKYGFGAQSAPSCDIFETSLNKIKAFADYPCYNGEGRELLIKTEFADLLK